MPESTDDITIEELLTAFRKNLLKVGRDNSVPGETQYFLYLPNHLSEIYFDWDRSIFVGSISGSEVTKDFIDRYYHNTMNASSINFVIELVNERLRFVKFIREDIENLK